MRSQGTSGRRRRLPGEEQSKRARRQSKQAQYENLRAACELAKGSAEPVEVNHLGLRLLLSPTEAPLGPHETLAVVRTRRFGLALAHPYGDTPDRRAVLYLSGGRQVEIINDTTSKRPFVAAYVSGVRAADGTPLTTLRAVQDAMSARRAPPTPGEQ